MTATATLNVRFSGASCELKKRGDEVLARAGISTSEAVRRLYAHLDETQTVPSWMKAEGDVDVFERRRRLMREMLQAIPSQGEVDVDALRKERLSKYDF